MTPDEAIDRYFAGEIPLYFLVPKGKDANVLCSEDFLREKCPEGLGILCWRNREGAVAFIEQRGVLGLALTVAELSVAEFDQLMVRNDPDRTGYDGLYCL